MSSRLEINRSGGRIFFRRNPFSNEPTRASWSTKTIVEINFRRICLIFRFTTVPFFFYSFSNRTTFPFPFREKFLRGRDFYGDLLQRSSLPKKEQLGGMEIIFYGRKDRSLNTKMDDRGFRGGDSRYFWRCMGDR